MKIGILTWHKAVNHGAVLQAYASQQTLKNLGCEAVILDHTRYIKRIQTPVLLKIKNIISKLSVKKLIDREIIKAFNREKEVRFLLFQKRYLNLGYNYNSDQNLDAVLIGSDMVFEFFQGYNPYMYGKDICAPYIFSYAASFGRTTEETMSRYKYKDEISSLLNKLDGIGYRDENTKKLISEFAKREDLVFNIDPVLLYGFEKEIKDSEEGKWKNHRPYLVIYSYDSHMNNPQEVRNIKEFAKDNNLDIVSAGYYHSWCDENICLDPKEFIEVIFHATYVITDTFHGSIFSLIMKKNFASVVRKNGFKLKYLLENSGMEERIVMNNDFNSVLLKQPNYGKFDEWLKLERSNSMKYLLDQIENAKLIKLNSIY